MYVLLRDFTINGIPRIRFYCISYKNSSGDEIANVNFFTTTSYNTSKCNPSLNIQHDADRDAASGCGLVALVHPEGPQGETFGNH